MSSAVERLMDVQIHNLQPLLLRAFDRTARNELASIFDVSKAVSRALHTLRDMSFIAYVMEIYFVHRIMARQKLNYRQFSKIQQEIEHVYRIFHRTWKLMRHTRGLFKQQGHVVKLLVEMSSFKDETPLDPQDAQHAFPSPLRSLGAYNFFRRLLGEFKSLVLEDIVFSYNPGKTPNVVDFLAQDTLAKEAQNLHPAIRRRLEKSGQRPMPSLTRIEFTSGKSYGLIGVNTAGKSTLAKILMRIFEPQNGRITFNGLDYKHLPRVTLRAYVTYVPSSPLLFDGTVRENIKIANPLATEEEIAEAATAAGVLEFLGIAMNRLERNQQTPRRRSWHTMKDKKSEDSSSSDDEKVESLFEDGAAGMFPFRESSKKSSSSESSDSESSSSEDIGGDLSGARKNSKTSEGLLTHSVSHPDLEVANAIAPALSASPKSSPLVEKRDPREAITVRNNPVIQALNSESDSVTQMLNRRVTRDTTGALAQSIALARLFVRPHAKVAILDEALNLMDQLKLRQIVMPKLFEFTKRHNICLIVITHNLSLLRELDHIFVMDAGKVVHSGTHRQLLAEKAKVYLQFMFPYHKQEQDMEELQRQVDTPSRLPANDSVSMARSMTVADMAQTPKPSSPTKKILHFSSAGIVTGSPSSQRKESAITEASLKESAEIAKKPIPTLDLPKITDEDANDV